MTDNNTGSIQEFKEFCEQVELTINAYSTELNDNKIFDNNEIKNIIHIINDIKEYREKIVATKEEQNEIDELFDTVKENFLNLKNKHISKYNEKVEYVEARLAEFNKIPEDKLTDKVKELIGKLGNNEKCEAFNNGDWQQSDYLDKLKFKELDEQTKIIEEIEKKLNIKHFESVDVWSRCNHIENTIGELKNSSKEEMSLSQINSLLKKSYLCYEEILDVDIMQQLYMENEHNKEKASAVNSKISRYVRDINKLIDSLQEKKKKEIKQDNKYKKLKVDLEEIETKYHIMNRKISEYQGKLGKRAINRFDRSYLKDNYKLLKEFIQTVDKEQNNLEKIQFKNLKKRISKLENIHNGINFILNISPFMINGVDIVKDFSDKMEGFDKKLDELKDKITDLGNDKLKVIKDHNKRKEIDSIINDRWKDLANYEKMLKEYKKNSPEVYQSLKDKLDERKKKFDEICKGYRRKCPLAVKQVKDAKHLYKKHKKIVLIAAGLAAFALVSHHVLIPAIMHGNIMVGATTPIVRPFTRIANDILGKTIGATKDVNGIWRMASGTIINPSCAGISLLKGLAIYTLPSSVAFLGPQMAALAIGIKKLSEKMKNVELKKQISEKIQKGKIKVTDLTHKVTEKVKKNKEKNYDDLSQEYMDSNMTFEEFCQQQKLNRSEINKLKAKLIEVMDKKKGSSR